MRASPRPNSSPSRPTWPRSTPPRGRHARRHRHRRAATPPSRRATAPPCERPYERPAGHARTGGSVQLGAPCGIAATAHSRTRRGGVFAPPNTFRRPALGSQAGDEAKGQWEATFARYAQAHPELAAEFTRRQSGELPAGWKEQLPRWTPEDKALATRQSSQLVLNKLAEIVPELMGGSADLTPSNLTKFRGALDFQSSTPEGRYIRFGVREHAMAAICNGLCAYGGIIPFCATFLNFTAYGLGAMRVSALSEFGVITVATHDSIGLGEDGPTHQPVEALLNFRATPNTLTLRPADANEARAAPRTARVDARRGRTGWEAGGGGARQHTAACPACTARRAASHALRLRVLQVSGAYAIALERRRTPCVIALSRQGCANLAASSVEAVAKGAYVVLPAAEPPAEVVLVGTGSEVQLLIDATKGLGLRAAVVSM
eukprot:2941104-Prymnesium_polylepis.1